MVHNVKRHHWMNLICLNVYHQMGLYLLTQFVKKLWVEEYTQVVFALGMFAAVWIWVRLLPAHLNTSLVWIQTHVIWSNHCAFAFILRPHKHVWGTQRDSPSFFFFLLFWCYYAQKILCTAVGLFCVPQCSPPTHGTYVFWKLMMSLFYFLCVLALLPGSYDSLHITIFHANCVQFQTKLPVWMPPESLYTPSEVAEGWEPTLRAQT